MSGDSQRQLARKNTDRAAGELDQRDQDEEQIQTAAPPSIASPTVLTRQTPVTPKLDLPVQEIDNAKKGKGTLNEVTLPFSSTYSGPEWNHLAGGDETASSRTSIARDTGHGENKGGIDFLVEHRETGWLVIGEQKAVDKGAFEKATAITVSLEKNVAQAKKALQAKVDSGQVHPEEVANVKKTIAKLDATAKALKNKTDLPEGVVFELTNLGGEGKAVGEGHINLLAKKYGKDPKFLEHLLSRTYVRDKDLAKAKNRPATGKRGTASDPEIVPANDALTPQAQDALKRIRAGKTEAQWKKQKANERKAAKKAESAQRKQATAAKRKQRQAETDQATATAKQAGKDARKQKLQELREQQKQSGQKPKNKTEREKAKKAMAREAKEAGKSAKDKSLDAFKTQRKQQDATERAQKKAAEQARKQASKQQTAAKRKASAQKKAAVAKAKAEKKAAIEEARKAGSLDTPKAILKMNEEAREAHRQKLKNNARAGKVAHVANQAAAGVRSYDAYEEAREQGKGRLEAGAAAGKTYLENTNPILGTIATAQMRQQKDANGEQYYGDDAVDAWLGTIGEVGAGYIVPGNAADQLINAGANLSGAVDDHMKRGLDPNDPARNQANFRTVTDLAADLTPSRMFSQTIGGGLRAGYDVKRAISGDTKGVTKFSDDAVKGKLGSIIQPWAMAGDFAGNLGSDDVGTALQKTVKKTEGTTLTKLGYASGDAMYELGQNKEAKAGKMGMSTQGISMLLGMSSDMIAGQDFEKAMENAAEAGKGSTADKIGSALGDAMYDAVEWWQNR